jgi:LAO/AO transport system kinase
MLKAGILEIGDVFVVNKADLPGSDRTVQELREMLELRRDAGAGGHHGHGAAVDLDPDQDGTTDETPAWRPPVVETVAETGEGVPELLDALADHRAYLEGSGRLAEIERTRYAEEIRTLLREDLRDLLADELDARGGLSSYVEAVGARETDPYAVADELIAPFSECVERQRATETGTGESRTGNGSDDSTTENGTDKQ